jgi:hypothetical protein
VTSTSIEAVKIIIPGSFGDSRGVLCETYDRKRFAEHGIALEFVQDTQSTSVKAGTVRGLHFQSSPAAQAKLVRVLRGSIFGVAVDLRRSSPSYGKWTAQHRSIRPRRGGPPIPDWTTTGWPISTGFGCPAGNNRCSRASNGWSPRIFGERHRPEVSRPAALLTPANEQAKLYIVNYPNCGVWAHS